MQDMRKRQGKYETYDNRVRSNEGGNNEKNTKFKGSVLSIEIRN